MMIRTPPLRLSILIALQEHLSGINMIDGYNYDLRGKVYRNRILLGEDVTSKPPAISIVEAPRSDIAIFTGEWGDIRRDQWTLLVQGIVVDDKTDNTNDDAYYLCQDVERRLHRLIATKEQTGRPEFPDEHLLGGKITSVEIAPPVVRPPEAHISTMAFFYLPVRLGIAAKIGK